MAKVKFFQKHVKSKGQGEEVKSSGTNRKVLSQGKHMFDRKPYLFWFKSYGQAKVFSKSRSKVKVKVMRSKFLVPTERIQSFYLYWLMDMHMQLYGSSIAQHTLFSTVLTKVVKSVNFIARTSF